MLQKKNIGKTVLLVIINIAVIALIAIIEFGLKKVDTDNIQTLYFKYEYLVFALLCVVVTVSISTIKFMFMMNKVFGKCSLKVAFETVMIGFYYNYITPLSIGGQPFQIYNLSRHGYSSGASATIPITEIVGQDISMAVLVIIAHIFVHIPKYNITISPLIIIASIIGFICYIAVPSLIIIFSKSPKKLESFVTKIIHLLSKIKLIKNKEMTIQKIISKLSDYTAHFAYLTKHPLYFIIMVLLSLLQRLSVCVLPFFIIHAFSGNISFIVSLVSTILLTSSVTFIPTPGNSGASEGVFYAIFSSLNAGHVFWATLVWRFFSYYIYLISGVGFVVKSTQLRQSNNSTKDENCETN